MQEIKKAGTQPKGAKTEANDPSQEDLNISAHDEALSDIEEDPDFSVSSPNDDLDEGETARLGENKTDLV
jgi:hypothetical protein